MPALFWFALLAPLLLFSPLPGAAQSAPLTFEQLSVELWPDYDRPSLLVLLTGSLPSGTPLPATITLPLPPEADLNAVARISPTEGMIDDIDYTGEAGQLTFATPDPDFRVEYYVPYQQDGDERTINFNWQSEIAIAAFQIRVQKPLFAGRLATTPEPASVTGQGQFEFYNFPVGPLAPGESSAVTVTYDLSNDQLSVFALGVPDSIAQPGSATQPGTIEPSAFDWPLLLILGGGLLVVAVLVWQFGLQRPSRVRKPRPRRSEPPAPLEARRPSDDAAAAPEVNFCRHCGQPVEPGDRFCHACGRPLHV